MPQGHRTVECKQIPRPSAQGVHAALRLEIGERVLQQSLPDSGRQRTPRRCFQRVRGYPMSEHPGHLWERGFHKEGSIRARHKRPSKRRPPSMCWFGNKKALRESERAASVTEEQGAAEPPRPPGRGETSENAPRTPTALLPLPTTPQSPPGQWPRPHGTDPDSSSGPRSSVMKLSTGTWPRRPWRSLFGIMTLENPTISLVRVHNENAV